MSLTGKRLDIAIIGHGIAGATIAQLLARQGHRIRCFERSCCDHPGGAGLLLQPIGQQVLRKMGLFNQALALGARVRSIDSRGHTGGPILDLHYSRWRDDAFGLGMQHGALLMLLRQSAVLAEVHYAMPILGVDPGEGLLHANGGMALGPFDLIIGADGRQALTRAAATRPPTLREYPWGARLCLLDDPGCCFGERLIQRYQGGAQLAVWPVGIATADAPRRINLSWRTQGPDLAKDFDLDQWRDQILALEPMLAPLLGQLHTTEQVRSVRYSAADTSCWGGGRLVLLGDAAHVMSPQLGQGASFALADAWTLAECLNNTADLAGALRRFATIREPQIRSYRRLSRWLTPLYQSPNPAAHWLRDRVVPALAKWPAFEGAMLRTLSGAWRSSQ